MIEDFQREAGLTFYQNYQQQKAQLTIKKRAYKSLAVKINEIKREIDRLIESLEIKKQNRSKESKFSFLLYITRVRLIFVFVFVFEDLCVIYQSPSEKCCLWRRL